MIIKRNLIISFIELLSPTSFSCFIQDLHSHLYTVLLNDYDISSSFITCCRDWNVAVYNLELCEAGYLNEFTPCFYTQHCIWLSDKENELISGILSGAM